ncbi:MFS transporter [Micromonospora sagamiensis]|uniref:Putative MFS family arabinose efflux permease n=1 Tax=Micromonospora sagamiensis TaxID=47875 RepID=A0A562WG33_9ACTN|nr:MFS transporter [Micromonospora sagamiensis]TWJ29250.1 putative MFS family arabinose efflux permease [Micromonospora sagamiensis]BCL17724.1 MFS transporter [Micromonospora sagamiensis]
MTQRVGERLDGRFGRLWAAATTSALGSGLSTVAAPLLVSSLTDDPVVVSGAFATAWLPWLLFALPGGVLVDRVDRRRLMIVVDWLRVAALVLLGVCVGVGLVTVALLYAVLFLLNTGEIVVRSASQAMVPAVVPRDRLERANGWLAGGTTVAQGMVANPLGGVLFVLAASVPFLVNAATYAVGAVLLAGIAGTYRANPAAGTRSVRADLVEGLRWLAAHRLLRTMALLIGLLNVTLTAAFALLVLLARDRLGLGSVGYGVLLTCMAVGSLAGALVGDRLIAAVSATWTIRIGLLTEVALHLTLAVSSDAYVVGAGLALFGVHSALWGIVASSLRQRLTPPDLLGRVGSANLFVAAGGNCVGALLGGVLAARFGLTAPYWVGFVVAVLVTAATWRVFDRATVTRAYAAQP